MAEGLGLEEGQVPCVKCGANAWPLQIALGQQVYTIWLCLEHIEACRATFGAWFGTWIGPDAPWLQREDRGKDDECE